MRHLPKTPRPAPLLAAVLSVLILGLGPACGGSADVTGTPDGSSSSVDGSAVVGGPQSDGGQAQADAAGGAQCRLSSDCPNIACRCADGVTVNSQSCKSGVCGTSASSCTTACTGHGGGGDAGIPGDAGQTASCDDNFRTGSNAVTGTDVYKACNSNPSKGGALPTNCVRGRFILFDTPQLCFCMLNCDTDFSPSKPAGSACSTDGTFFCRRVKNKAGNVNNLCLAPAWDQSLCKAP